MITCNHTLLDEYKEKIQVDLANRHKNREKLTSQDKRWIESTSLRQALFRMIKTWANDPTIYEDTAYTNQTGLTLHNKIKNGMYFF